MLVAFCVRLYKVCNHKVLIRIRAIVQLSPLVGDYRVLGLKVNLSLHISYLVTFRQRSGRLSVPISTECWMSGIIRCPSHYHNISAAISQQKTVRVSYSMECQCCMSLSRETGVLISYYLGSISDRLREIAGKSMSVELCFFLWLLM